MSDEPPPLDLARAQKVWTWYVVYCVLMALMYTFFAFMGAVMVGIESDRISRTPMQMQWVGWFFIAMGVFLGVPFAAAPLLPKRGWTWILGIVLISFGMTSACCMPAAIPLLIFWIKPETKALFARRDFAAAARDSLT